MEQCLENVMRFIIEVIKLLLVGVNLFNIRVNKKINYLFGACIVFVMIISINFDLSKISIIFGLIAIIICSLGTTGKDKIKIFIFSYIGISVLDMLIVNVIITIFKLKLEQFQGESHIEVLLNSISIFFIILYIVITKKKNKKIINSELVPIYLICGISLSVYLTALQFIGMGEKIYKYRNEMIFGICISTIVLISVCVMLNRNKNENQRLKIENDLNNRLIEAQGNYYKMLLEKEYETKGFRHDIREHINCMSLLYRSGKYAELGKYIDDFELATIELSPKYNTGNDYVNLILADMSDKYKDVKLIWKGKIPELEITYMDICTLFYNLMKNSFEAADKSDDKEVITIIKIKDKNLYICVSNKYKEISTNSNGEIVSTKKNGDHGYGLSNIKKCVYKYNGVYSSQFQNLEFKTEIILPQIVK